LILDRKMDNIEASDSDMVLTGNPGCLLQLDYGRRATGSDKPVLHPVQVLDAAYRAGRTASNSPARFIGVDTGEKLRGKGSHTYAIAADGKTRVLLAKKRKT
ncbi:MAG TPA: (Fe-S)-binding protein, partial [Chloroflexia bacterium]|nr:(Fe-S)-binding protein [Chloroflexia bacterium]